MSIRLSLRLKEVSPKPRQDSAYVRLLLGLHKLLIHHREHGGHREIAKQELRATSLVFYLRFSFSVVSVCSVVKLVF